MLDALAAAWVKLHWRYRPAMRDGQAIAEPTMAIVTFAMGVDARSLSLAEDTALV